MKLHKFITHLIFTSERITMLHIINAVQLDENNKPFYITHREGRKEGYPSLEGSIGMCNPSDIDIKESLHYWYKKNQQHVGKELVRDESLTEGESYFGNCWHYGLMLLPTATEIKWNFIID